MAELREGNSEVWKGARRGAGWALGMGTIVCVGTVLGGGGRSGAKRLVKGFLRAREVVAELGEQARDLYAEAQAEYPPDPSEPRAAGAPETSPSA
jgi:hypothetical protein